MLTGATHLLKPTRECREMAVLAEIGRSEAVSQRSLARAAGVSATMINAYVDDLVGRGLIEVTGDTNRTYRYHLTESGKNRHEEIFRELVREVFELYGRLKRELRVASGDEPGDAPMPEAQSA
jgi:DNA-binding MarR family transcriptional regulator